MDPENFTELDVPDGVRDAKQAIEVLRAWIGDGALYVTFDPETFQNGVPEWGRLLGDIGRHVAHAVALDGQMSHDEALAAIREALLANLGSSIPNMAGGIRRRTQH